MKFLKNLSCFTLLFLSLVLFTCQEEKINSNSTNSQVNSKIISLKTINYESDKYVSIKQELNKLRPSFNSNHFSARNYDEPILVDSSSIKHIITEDGYESFTFNIINSEDAYLLENLVLSKKDNEDIQTFLVKYNLNEAIENIDLSNIDGKIDSKEYIKLDYDEDGTVYARCGNVCVEAGYYITVPSCYGELVTPGENPGCFNEDGTRGSVQVFVQIAQACTYVQCGGSSGGNYTNNTNSGDSGDNVTSSGGNFTTTTYTNPDIITTPIKISAQQQLKNNLGINNLTPEIISWIDDPANAFIVGSINQFLIDNADENENITHELINEAILTLKLKTLVEPNWDFSQTGFYDNNSALEYTAIYHLPDGSGAYFLLVNNQFPELNRKQVLLVSNTSRIINNNNSFHPTDIPLDGAWHYLYNYDTERWYEFGLPTNIPDCLSCDLNDFFDAVLSNTLIVTGRYFLPVEDIIILIDGKDFDGVESSRAVAAGFLLVDLVPGVAAVKAIKLVKYGDEVIQAAQVVIKVADNIYKTQKQAVKNVLDGIWLFDLDEFGNTIRKGNFGEMATDVDLYAKGYDPKHVRRTDLDQPLDQGIDGVFQNPETGEFIIVESKYTSTGNVTLGNTLDGPQMSDTWIRGSDRLINEVGEELADDILEEGYTRVLSKILPDGSITYFELDSLGNIIGNWTP